MSLNYPSSSKINFYLSRNIISSLKPSEELEKKDYLKNYINSLLSKVSKLQKELNLIKKETELYKEKLIITEQLNKTLESQISELKRQNEENKKKYLKDNNLYLKKLSEYKLIFEQLKEDKQKNESEIFLLNKNLIEIKNNFEIKTKGYELLLYKMDLENQEYKNEIQKYKITINNNEAVYKIDLNEEMKAIKMNNNNNYNEIIAKKINDNINNYNYENNKYDGGGNINIEKYKKDLEEKIKLKEKNIEDAKKLLVLKNCNDNSTYCNDLYCCGCDDEKCDNYDNDEKKKEVEKIKKDIYLLNKDLIRMKTRYNNFLYI